MERLGTVNEVINIDGEFYEMHKREAKVGEKILIVEANTPRGHYSEGDVLTIVHEDRWGDGEAVETEEVGLHGIYHEEYVVLTPYEGTYEVTSSDMVEHPSHYTSGKFEVIEIINEVTKGYDDSFVGYCIGNTQKYIARAPHKGKLVEDLRKAAKYLEFAIEHLESDSE